MKKLFFLMVVVSIMMWGIVDASAYSVSITKTYNGDYGDNHYVSYFTSDIYDFSSYNFTDIDSFDLSLSFSGTNDQNFLFNNEHWRVRLENGNINYWLGIHNTALDLDMVSSGSGITTQNFTIDPAVDAVIAGETPFADMAANQQFILRFAEESLNSHLISIYPLQLAADNDQFHLVSATVTANGSTVPIPGAVWLLGSGLVGLVAVRRRKKS